MYLYLNAPSDRDTYYRLLAEKNKEKGIDEYLLSEWDRVRLLKCPNAKKIDYSQRVNEMLNAKFKTKK